MKRPIVFILLFYILGILIGQYAPYGAAIVFFIILLYMFSFIIYKKYNLLFIFLFPILSLIGIVMIQNNLKVINNDIELASLNNKKLAVNGIVLSKSETKSGNYKYKIKTEKFEINDKIYRQKMHILLYCDEENFNVGNKIYSYGKINKLRYPVNPGGYNEFLYLKTRKIQYNFYSEKINIIGNVNNINTFINKIQNKFKYVYESVLPEKEASLLEAMILGDKSNLDNSVKLLYSNAGIYHIIAISGLHISIISGMLAIIANKISRRFGNIFVISALIFYCILTGASPSTVRAVIMTSIVLIGFIIHKTPDMISSLCTAAILILIYQPMYLFDVGFQFSFSAVLGIAVISRNISDIIKIKKLKNLLNANLAVYFMTKPISAYYFFTFSFIDIIVNIIILPFVSFIVLFGIITGIVGLFSLSIAKFCVGIVYVILKGYEFICTVASSIPFSQIIIGRPSLFYIVFYYLILIFFAYTFKKGSKEVLERKNYMIALILSFLIIFLTRNSFSKNFNISMLSVGQGDCIVAKNKNYCFIIDGGGSAMKEIGQDTGINILLPYLKYESVRKVNSVFITHTDDDHIKGILEIIGKIKIENIFVSDAVFNDAKYDILIDYAEKYDVPVYKLNSKDKIKINKDTFIKCIYPIERIDMDSNNSSLVLKFIYKDVSFLFTGDIEKEAEEIILKSDKNISADVLKLAHHGSKTSTQDEFLNKVNPEIAIVSSGKNNTYNLPSKQTVEKLKNKNIPLINTAEEGAILISTDGKSIKFDTMLEVNKFETIKK